jgi:hypothetical protein
MAVSNFAISGFGGSVSISSSLAVAVKQWNGTINVETADVTGINSSGWRGRLVTITDITGDFTTNQFLNLTVGTPRNFILKVGSTVTTTKPSFTFRATHSTGIQVPAAEVEFSHSFESDGPIAVATS